MREFFRASSTEKVQHTAMPVALRGAAQAATRACPDHARSGTQVSLNQGDRHEGGGG